MSISETLPPERPSRPVGVSLISVWHLLNGVGWIIVAVWLLFMSQSDPRIAEGAAEVGVEIPVYVAGFLFLAVLSLGSGVGLWKGAPWGWYLASFYCLYSIVRHVSALFDVSDLFASSSPEEIAASKHGIEYYYVKFGGRIVFSALIYLYFFKRSVRDYFELAHVRRWKVVLIQLAICAAIVLVVAVWLIAIE